VSLYPAQGDYIWIEPISGREFDVAIGARVISAEGRRIQVKDDDNKVITELHYMLQNCPILAYLALEEYNLYTTALPLALSLKGNCLTLFPTSIINPLTNERELIFCRNNG